MKEGAGSHLHCHLPCQEGFRKWSQARVYPSSKAFVPTTLIESPPLSGGFHFKTMSYCPSPSRSCRERTHSAD